MKHLLAAWFLASGTLLVLAALPATPALADVDGNCQASIAGESVAGRSASDPDDAIVVAEGQTIPVDFTSDAGFASHTIKLQATAIGGTSVTVSDETDDGETSFSESVDVDDYAWAGAGLYRVTGNATLSDDSSCSGAVLVNVDKPATETAAGMIAIGATAIGFGGLLGANVAAGAEAVTKPNKIEDWVLGELEKGPSPSQPEPEPEPGQQPPQASGAKAPSDADRQWNNLLDAALGYPLRWCLGLTLPALMITGLMMVGLLPTTALAAGGGTRGGTGAIRLHRMGWRPRISIVGVIGSVLFGLGFVVFLQQSGEIFPDLADFATYIGLGLLLGIVVPSLIRVVTVMRVNRAIAGAEARLNARYGGGQKTAPSQPQQEPPATPPDTGSTAPEGGSDGPQ